MSQLRLSASGQPDFFLNVLSFDAPISGEMNNAQTRTLVQYFPIKSMQNDLVCTCIFPSEAIWQQWQLWAYQSMVNLQQLNYIGGLPGVQLNWPQRGINQWSAIIPRQEGGGRRSNYTPRQTIRFQLIVNLVSNLTVFQSWGMAWQTLYSNNYINTPLLDGLLNPPTQNFGSITPGNAAIIANNQYTSTFGNSTAPGSASIGNTTVSGGSAQIPGVSYPTTGGTL